MVSTKSALGLNGLRTFCTAVRRRNTTQDDVNHGIVIVGFAPLKPAEFVIIKVRQLARQMQA